MTTTFYRRTSTLDSRIPRDAIRGWDDAEKASKVRVVMPERPEGYWHTDPKGEDW